MKTSVIYENEIDQILLLQRSRTDVETQARTTLEDVVADFSSLREVMSRFEEWKEQDPESYSDAYVSLTLCKIFSPLIRLQILFWNPFSVRNHIWF